MIDRNFRKVRVIHTGGTIGMIPNKNKVLEPLSGEFENRMRVNALTNDPQFQGKLFGDRSGTAPLVLPEIPGQKRILYYISEYNPLLDSSNMSMDDWIRIAEDIYESYEHFDGFVILHGTDTLAYTASALSFMLENLGKTVIVTGSQLSIFEVRSDGFDNFISSLVIAGNFIIPEVTVYFNNKLFRGNRTVKVDSSSFLAFDSPNMPPIADVGININVHYRNIFRPSGLEKFKVHSKLNQNIGLLRIFPSISSETIKSFLQPPIQGVVLQTYGSGNAPCDRLDLLKVFTEASKRGVIIVNCTQCQKGAVADLYQSAHPLLDAGVILGYDMTPEAALTKLAYVLSMNEWDLETKKTMIQSNIRGELTGQRPPCQQDVDLVDAVARTLYLLGPMPNEVEQLNDILFPAMLTAAVDECDTNKLSELKGYGANLSGTNGDLRTPLHMACVNGDVEVVRYLLSNGSSIHMRDRYGQTPLLDAIDFDHHEVILLLRKCGAHLTMHPLQLAEKLCSAASFGRVDRLQSYKLAGANLSQQDLIGRTAMHMGIMTENLEVVKFLLESKVDLDVLDKLGNSPLNIAQTLKYKEIEDLIIASQKRGSDSKKVEIRPSDFTAR